MQGILNFQQILLKYKLRNNFDIKLNIITHFNPNQEGHETRYDPKLHHEGLRLVQKSSSFQVLDPDQQNLQKPEVLKLFRYQGLRLKNFRL